MSQPILFLITIIGFSFIAWGIVAAWYIWPQLRGRSRDLLYAFYDANRLALDPGQLGAGYFIVAVFVPLLLITHGLLFRLLLSRDLAAEPDSRRAA